MQPKQTLFAATVVSLLMLSGCASVGAQAVTESGGGSSASDREDILQVMERDSRGG